MNSSCSLHLFPNAALDMTSFAEMLKEAWEVDDVELSDATCTYVITYDSYDDLGDLTPSDL